MHLRRFFKRFIQVCGVRRDVKRMNATLQQIVDLAHDSKAKVDTILVKLNDSQSLAKSLQEKLDNIVGGEGDDAALQEAKKTLAELDASVRAAARLASGTDDQPT